MLQPLQLQDVLARCPADIAELREFFVKAGLPVDTGHALGKVVERLQHDPGFHRDLTSHVWISMDRLGRGISYPDLLGVLALAAAGVRFAVVADEDDAHRLLRFLMEAGRSLETGSREGSSVLPEQESAAAPSPMAVPASDRRLQVVRKQEAREQEAREQEARQQEARQQKPAEELAVPARRTDRPASRTMPVESRRGVWVAVAACVLMASLGGWWLHRRASVPEATVPRPNVADAVQPLSATMPDDGSVKGDSGGSTEGAFHDPAGSPSERRQPAISAPRMPREASNSFLPRTGPAASATPVPASASTFPLPRLPDAAPSPPVLQPPAPAVVVPPSRTGQAYSPFHAIPSSTLSKRLGARTIPSYAADEEAAPGSPWRPHLLRRHAPLPASSLSENNGELLAEVEPADIPGRPGSSRLGTANTANRGIVRPTLVGTMAANVLYSPAPAYPPAASAAHVQGEVKVQAQVDTDGSVLSARVVSGPPLLRDAALDAVQRWRYRPYLSSGKPVRMSATAIVEFELP